MLGAEQVVVVDDHLHLFPDLFSTTLWLCGVTLGVAQGEAALPERRFAFLFLSLCVKWQGYFAKALETLWLEVKRR